MRVLSLRPLQDFWKTHPDAEAPLREWYKNASTADWSSLIDVRQVHAHVGPVTIKMIDRLMQIEILFQGQADYLETLIELVEVYEAKNHAIDVAELNGVRMLKHILQESDMIASDVARLLGMHPSPGSKILNGDRKLTWEHAKTLGARSKLAPAIFMN